MSHCVRLPHYKFRGFGDPMLLCCIGFVSIPYKNGNKQAALLHFTTATYNRNKSDNL